MSRAESTAAEPEPATQRSSGFPWRWIGAGAVVLGLFAAWTFLPLSAWLESFTGWIEGLGLWGAALFAAVYAVATVLLVPGSVLTLGAGVTYGLWGFPVVAVGATVGAMLAFLVGRYAARRRVEARLANDRRFRAVDQAVEDEGWKIVALLRLSPLLPFNLQNYLYGITKVRFLPYSLATFFGILPGTLMYVYFGAAGRAALTGGEDSGDGTLTWIFFAVGLLATVAATVLVAKKAKAKLDDIGVAEGDED